MGFRKELLFIVVLVKERLRGIDPRVLGDPWDLGEEPWNLGEPLELRWPG
jgi:hypothetical protein